MTVSLAMLRADLRTLLDKTQFRDALLTQWMTNAVHEYSAYFPLHTNLSISCLAGLREYSLTGAGLIFAVDEVEYPSGEEPRQYLTRLNHRHPSFLGGRFYDISPGYTDLVLGETPGTGESITLFYATNRSMPATEGGTFPVPVEHLELIRMYVIWKAVQALENEAEVGTEQKETLINTLGLNSVRAEQIYRSRLKDILSTRAEGVFGPAWGMDQKDRVY